MKYRLKMDNIYVIETSYTWKTADEINMKNVLIPANSRTLYTLEWYWEESDNDTLIGKKDYADYELSINIVPNIEGEE